MEKIWLKSYPPGITEEIKFDSFSSLKDLVETSCKKYSSQPAFTNMGREMSFGELDQKSRYLAAYLQQVAGLVKGDRVALMMPNILQYPIAIVGVLRAGFVGVNVNPARRPAGISKITAGQYGRKKGQENGAGLEYSWLHFLQKSSSRR